jgi:PAS domain S-box-containing protein
MEQLIEVVQHLSMARDLEAVMKITRTAARKLTGADGATFVLRDGDKCFYAEEDAISPLWRGQRFPMKICISGWVMMNKTPAIIEDIYADPRIPADAYRPTFVRSLAMVPIRTIDPVGAIGNYWATPYKPTPEQVKVLQALADTTAVALENVRIYSELDQRVSERTSEISAILDNVQVGILFVKNGSVVRANPKAADIFGLQSANDLLGIALEQLFQTEKTKTSILHKANDAFSVNKVFDIETRLRRKDGSPFWAHIVTKLIGAVPGPNCGIWLVDDISTPKEREDLLKKMKLAAEESTRFKSEFLATMSHEIRTPLTGMLGMLELLSLTKLDHEQQSTLDTAWGSARSLLRIVNDILDWSKIQEGKLELSLQSVSIPQVLQEVVNTYSRLASAKSLTLWQHSDPRLSQAHLIDPLRLTQVLNNFVSNAIRFTSQGEIKIRAELLKQAESGEQIRFSVKDSGVGISKDVQTRLFQRYRQESADTARMYGGTGLGLAICQRLADLMDGQIELESEAGLGSTFSITLTLPVSGVPGESVQYAYPDVAQGKVAPLFESNDTAPLVLSVDDHPINRDLLASQLKLLGLRAIIAENGKEALALWQQGDVATVITDCHMPEMDGYTLTQEIRKIETEDNRPHTTIIAWTANALADEAHRCRAAGMDDVLVKPASVSQLKLMLEKHLAGESHCNSSSSPVTLPPESVQSSSLIDLSILSQIVPDESAQIQALHDFHAYLHPDFELLVQHIDTENLSEIERMAHRLNGSCRMVGAQNLSAACSAIEQAAKDGNVNNIKAAKSLLEDAVKKFDAYLDDIVNLGKYPKGASSEP